MSYDRIKSKLAEKYPAISDLAAKSKNRMPKVAWEYLKSGTGLEDLVDRNQEALQQIQFLPRFCKGPLQADLSTPLFGQLYQAPIGIAPVGLSGLMWPRVECHLASAAHRQNIPYCLSTVATETPETIGPMAGAMGWFQLYPPKDINMRNSLLSRAQDAGFQVLVVTADVPMASRRERTKRAGMTMPPRITPKMIWDGISHPIWSYYTLRRGLPRLRTVEHYTNNNDMKFVSGFVGNRLGGTLDWEYCEQLKNDWNGPVVIKGLLHPKDVRKAIDIGLDGIYVSNHGGRQFNGAPATIDALPAIVQEVNREVPIIFDGGIRSGLDILRALYVGADFVFAGRPFIYGVGAIGQNGGDHVTHILMDDLQNNMVQLGVSNIEEIKDADLFTQTPK